MSHRREAKQQRRVAIMEKRRRMDQVVAQMIQERLQRRLALGLCHGIRVCRHSTTASQHPVEHLVLHMWK